MVNLVLSLYLMLQGLTVYDIQYTTDPSGASPYEGQVVTVYGIVTAGSDEWARSLSGGFFIADGPGAWHGVFVWAPSSSVHRGDSVVVTGTVQEYYGRTEISASSVSVLATRRPVPEPTEVTLSEIATGSSSAESFEGVLVRVSQAWVVDPNLGYGEWLVEDPTGQARVDDASDYVYSPTTEDTLYLQGILDYSYSNFKLEPRGNADIIVLSEPLIMPFFSRSVDVSIANPIEAKGNVRLDSLLAVFLSSANYSIDFCFYSISSWAVVDTLISQYQKGIKVRVITEHDNRNSYTTALENAGITVIDDAYGSNSGQYSMHNKFAILDVRDSTTRIDDRLWTGSYNASYQSAIHNNDNVIIIRDSLIARAYTLEFEEMWGSSDDTPNSSLSKFQNNKTNNTPHSFYVGDDTVFVYFSPTDLVLSHIISTVYSAQRSIYFTIYAFTHQDVSNAMKSRWDLGTVMVAGVFDSLSWLDPDQNFESWDLLGLGGGNPWNPPAYVAPDAVPNGVLHNKVMIIDGDYPSINGMVITGSTNWTYTAVNHNDENMVIVKSKVIANQYLQEFKARWEETGNTYPPGEFSIHQIQVERNSGDSTLYLGRRLITRGTVTGIFGSRFFLQNTPVSPWNGIYVNAFNLDISSLNLGDSVKVMGLAVEDSMMTGVSMESGGYVEVIQDDVPIETLSITIPDIAESLECLLVGMDSVMFVETGDFSEGFYHVFRRDDTALVYIDPESDMVGLPIPSGSIDLIGVLEERGGLYFVTPRYPGDVGAIVCTCGDVNGDGTVLMLDLLYLGNYLFFNGPPPPYPECSDVNADGLVDSSDLLYLANYIFFGGPPPNCW